MPRNQNRHNRGHNAHHGDGLNKIHAPYNFVRLSRNIFFPKWADQVSHDIPFEDGLCGTLNICIRSHTPLLLGEKHGQGPVRPFRLLNGQYAIPGSSLRGMIRNVVEIAAFGKMRMVDDKRYGVRDLTTGARKLYGDRMTRNDKHGDPRLGPFEAKVNSGWLCFDEIKRHWTIVPCDYARVECSDLSGYFNGKWSLLLSGTINSDGSPKKSGKKIIYPTAIDKYEFCIKQKNEQSS